MTETILRLAAAAALAATAAYAIPWLAARTKNERLQKLLVWVQALVRAAEQTLTGGAEKKAYVVAQLSKMGVRVTEEVDALIESAVQLLNAGGAGK